MPEISNPATAHTPLPGPPQPLHICVPGNASQECSGPAFYLVERDVSELEENVPDLAFRLRHALPRITDELASAKRNDTITEPVTPNQVAFLDLETTGLSSTPVFLIGLLVCRDGTLVCQQLLARTYPEERSILERYTGLAEQLRLLITFNGKSFDVPYLRARSAATGTRFREVDLHLDLLHVARRVYKGKFTDCKLQTLERFVCRRPRAPDGQ